MEIKTKINKQDLIKQKLLHSKESHKQNLKQPSEWEKIFANNAIDQGLIFKIQKQFILLNI